MHDKTQQLTSRGFNKTLSTRAITIYTSIYKATRIPNHTDDIIIEVDNITKNKENSISGSIYDGVDIATQEKKNSISGITINIYDASGQIGENNKLVNNSGCNNINDNNNISGLDNEENTPGGVNCENNIKLLQSVDSYPLNLQTEIPEIQILRLRGGVNCARLN
jgi:hypothetical protein